MPFGTEIDLGPGHIVLDGDPAPLPKKDTVPNFWPMSIVAKSITAEQLYVSGYHLIQR